MEKIPKLSSILKTGKVNIDSIESTTLRAFLNTKYSNVDVISTDAYIPYNDIKELNDLIYTGKLIGSINFINEKPNLREGVIANYSFLTNFIGKHYPQLFNIFKFLVSTDCKYHKFISPFSSFIKFIIKYSRTSGNISPSSPNSIFKQCYYGKYRQKIDGTCVRHSITQIPSASSMELTFQYLMHPLQNKDSVAHEEYITGVSEWVRNQAMKWNTVLDCVLNMIKRDNVTNLMMHELLTLYFVVRPSESYRGSELDVLEYLLLEKMDLILNKITLEIDDISKDAIQKLADTYNKNYTSLGKMMVDVRSFESYFIDPMNISMDKSKTNELTPSMVFDSTVYGSAVHLTSLIGYYVCMPIGALNINERQKALLESINSIPSLNVRYANIENIYICLYNEYSTNKHGNLIIPDTYLLSNYRALISVFFDTGLVSVKKVLGVPAVIITLVKKLEPSIIGFITYLHNMWGIWYPTHPLVINYCLNQAGFQKNDYQLLNNIPNVKTFINPSVESLDSIFNNQVKVKQNTIREMKLVLEVKGTHKQHVVFETGYSSFIDMVDGRPIFNQSTELQPTTTDVGVFQVLEPVNNFIALLNVEEKNK